MKHWILKLLLISIFLFAMPPQASALQKVIHTGSYSLDRNNLTQIQITAQVNTIVMAIPSTTHIAIGTYLDYPVQIQRWTSAIHNAGKKVWFRSVGSNDWDGHNGVTIYQQPDFAEKQQVKFTTFFTTYGSYFQSGDIVECVPDEPENSKNWKYFYTSFSNPVAKTAYNNFLQTSLLNCQAIFQGTGVETNYIFTNPSMTRDVMTASTAAMLTATGVEVYPERLNGVPYTQPSEMATAMQNQLNVWVVPAHPTKPKHLTFGPSVWYQLTQEAQKDTYELYWPIFLNTITNLDGLTIWSAGANDNASKARIFDYLNNAWMPRQATTSINQFFLTH